MNAKYKIDDVVVELKSGRVGQITNYLFTDTEWTYVISDALNTFVVAESELVLQEAVTVFTCSVCGQEYTATKGGVCLSCTIIDNDQPFMES